MAVARPSPTWVVAAPRPVVSNHSLSAAASGRSGFTSTALRCRLLTAAIRKLEVSSAMAVHSKQFNA